MRSFVLDGLRFLRARSNRRIVLSLSALLGIAIGASTVVLGLVDSLFWRPLPFPAAGRLVDVGLVTRDQRSLGELGRIPSYAHFEAWRKAHVFEASGAFATTFPTEAGRSEARRVIAIATSASTIGLLGGQPILGRALIDDDDRLGQAAVAILSAKAWQLDYAGDSSVLGRSMTLDGRSYEIVGVMPPGFRIPNSVPETQRDEGEIWTSLGSYLDRSKNRAPSGSVAASPGVDVVGRLRPNETLSMLQASLEDVARRSALAGDFRSDSTLVPVPIPLRDRIIGEARRPVLVVSGAVLLFLLVACADAAGILLAQSMVRTPELALRIALGGRKRRIAAQLMAEALALSMVGGVVGVVLGSVGLPAVIHLYGPELPDVGPRESTGAIILFAMAVSTLVGLAMAAGPLLRLRALNTAAPSGVQALRRDSWNHRLLGPLIVAEVALTLTLVGTAALLVGSLLHVQYRSRGYDARSVIAVPVLFSPPYADKTRQDAFVTVAMGRLASIPGVTNVAVSSGAPIIGGPRMAARGLGASTGVESQVGVWATSPTFLRALRIPVVRGELSDLRQNGRTVVLDVAAARALFGVQESVGRSIVLEADSTPLTVIAIVGNMDDYDVGDWTGPATHTVEPHAYVSLSGSKQSFGRLNFIVRAQHTGGPVLSQIRRVIGGIDRGLPVEQPSTLQQLIDFATSRERFLGVVVSFFAVLGILTAVGGIYALVAYTAARRTREMGIRLALGSTPRQVVRLVTRGGLRLTLCGITCGVPLSFGVSRALRGYVVDVSLADPRVEIAMTALLLAVGALASYLASRRVARVDPVDALRET